jgi:IclR family acetate operon transcriptional repressor
VHGGRLVYEAVLEGVYGLRSLPSEGMTVPAHCSALGKAVLAASPAGGRAVLLGPEPYQRFTEHTATTRAVLDKELAQARRRGYAEDREESETGLTCVAAVITAAGGRPAAAMSISGLSDRMHRLGLAGLGAQVRASCAAISVALSG